MQKLKRGVSSSTSDLSSGRSIGHWLFVDEFILNDLAQKPFTPTIGVCHGTSRCQLGKKAPLKGIEDKKFSKRYDVFVVKKAGLKMTKYPFYIYRCIQRSFEGHINCHSSLTVGISEAARSY